MKADTETEKDILIVTGFSGAGMTTVLKTLEDFGYEVFDNFPLLYVPHLVEDSDDKKKPIAIGLDTRTRGFKAASVLKLVKKLKAKLLFLSCADKELYRRFTETRRRHPLAKNKSVRHGINQEKKILKDVQDHAHVNIDTTHHSVHDIRHILEGHYLAGDKKTLTITLMSFGFKHGTPREADMMMDVRFLKNPHWDSSLKKLTGKDKKVGEYIQKDGAFEGFFENYKNLLNPLLPRFKEEGKSYLTIAIGCTGGRHRSVYIVEELAKWLKKKDVQIHIEHRDLKN